jgi:NAD(P)-dependent dehydrogenase (short-subunit alcohol dehydrogenase family)
MKEIAGRIAVVTGGGSGMGRELVRQLVAEACNVSMCDLAAEGMAETVRLCEAAGLPQGLRVTTHIPTCPTSRRWGASVTRSPTVTPPTGSICCSTMPVSAAAAA